MCSIKFHSKMISAVFCVWSLIALHYVINSSFTALHVMQTRYSEENSVCPSVCLSVCHTRDPWQNGRKICPDLYTIRKNIYPSFLRRRMVVGGGATPCTWNFGSTDPPWSEIADFQLIIARSSSAVTHSERSSINGNRKSTTCFLMSVRWSL